MALQNHGYLLKGGISCTLTYSVDCHLNLTGTIDYALKSIGCSHTKVVVAVGRYLRFLNAIDMLHEVLNLIAILLWETIACGIRDIDYGSTCLDNSLNDTGKILIVGTTCVLGIELYILDVLLGILNGADCPLENLLTVGVELIFNVAVAGSESCVYALALSVLKAVGSNVNILFLGTCQGADGRPRYCLAYLDNRIEVAGT